MKLKDLVEEVEIVSMKSTVKRLNKAGYIMSTPAEYMIDEDMKGFESLGQIALYNADIIRLEKLVKPDAIYKFHPVKLFGKNDEIKVWKMGL